jgi:phosphoenolpyruvate carboxylase
MLRVVPLFETLTDLNNAADVCETLFSLPGYLEATKFKQEIMVRQLHVLHAHITPSWANRLP